MCASFGRPFFPERVAELFRGRPNPACVLQVIAVMHLAGVLLVTSGCGHPPALEFEDAFTTADALYTAITSRRAELVNAVEADLRQLHSKGQLSADAMGSLSEIIETARSGSWQQAAEDLDYFIRNQPEHQHAH